MDLDLDFCDDSSELICIMYIMFGTVLQRYDDLCSHAPAGLPSYLYTGVLIPQFRAVNGACLHVHACANYSSTRHFVPMVSLLAVTSYILNTSWTFGLLFWTFKITMCGVSIPGV